MLNRETFLGFFKKSFASASFMKQNSHQFALGQMNRKWNSQGSVEGSEFLSGWRLYKHIQALAWVTVQRTEQATMVDPSDLQMTFKLG